MAFCATAVLIIGVLANSKLSSTEWPSLSFWIVGAAFLPWIQWVVGVSFFAGDALMVSYFLVGWACAIFIGFQLSDEHSQLSTLALMHMLWMAAVLSAMVGLLQWLKLEGSVGLYVAQTDVDDPAMGNMAQPNQLATLLLMGIVAYGYVFERRIIGSFTFVLGIFVMTAVLVVTHSRAGILGVLVVSSFFFLKAKPFNSRLTGKAVLVWTLLFILANIISPAIDGALMLNTEREPLFTANGRILIWTQAQHGILASPWFGYGWNQTFTALAVGSVAHPGEMFFTYAHNVLVDILAWNGVPMGLILIGLGGYWFLSRLYRVTTLDGTYAMACLLPFTLHSLVEFPFAYAYFLIAAGLMMGVVEKSMVSTKTWHVNRLWSGTALVSWMIVGGCIAYEYLLIEEDVRVTRFENLRVGVTDNAYHVPTISLLSHMATMQRASRQQPVLNMTVSQLDDMRRAVLRFPHGGLALRYAMALGLNGDPTGAHHMMVVIRSVYGSVFFSRAKIVWHEQSEKYPVLSTVQIDD